jgi:hypothetical protein
MADIEPLGASGSYSNSAITSLHAGQPLPANRDEQILAAKISRVMSSGPLHITKDATSSRWIAKATPSCFAKAPMTGCASQVTRMKSATCPCARIPWGCNG